jgi:hypothetical protein
MDENNRKLKRGDRREDGMVFWQGKCNQRIWYDQKKFDAALIEQQKKSREYYIKNRERIIAYVKSHTIKNIEKKKEYWRGYSKKTKAKRVEYRKKYKIEKAEKLRVDGKKYRESRKEKLREYFREYTQKHKEKITARKRKYDARKPEIGMEAKAKNRAKRRNAAKDLTDSQKKINRQFFLMARRLKQCTKIDWHVDHIIPISRGGLHVPSNLMPIPAKLNLWKSARTDLSFREWAQREELILKP